MKEEILERIDGSMGRVYVHNSSCEAVLLVVIEADKSNIGSPARTARTCLYNAAERLLPREKRQAELLPKGRALGLNRIDLFIVAVYLAGITLFGLRFRKRQRTMRDYFLADRDIPWWAIALSIVAAETSTLTIISIPGLAYDSNFTFLQLVMGYVIGRVIISFILLPQYFRGDLYTAYQLIERRFGPHLRSVTAAIFLVTRACAEGVRVYAVSIVVSIALGTGEITSIAIITLLTLIYTFEGGLAAVIWTDVVQTFIYVGGTLVGLFTILHLIPGGWASAHVIAASLDKFRVFDPTFAAHWPFLNFAKPYTLWAGIIGGAFFTTASHGTDQLIVQRLLAARNQRQSVTALLASGVAILFQFALFLFVGAMLYAYYQLPSSSFGRADRIYPTFIVTRMPPGIAGLLIAAILAAAMSNLSAALNSLSSSTMMDFFFRWRPQSETKTETKTDDSRRLRLARLATLAWALVLFGLAVLALHRVGRVVEVGLQIAMLAYGALLGVFLLGVLTKRANQTGAIVGMIAGLALELYLWRYSQVAFTWWVPIGTLLTFAVGYLASLLLAKEGNHGTGHQS
jgi:solute:Na+ symporter, SSS family